MTLGEAQTYLTAAEAGMASIASRGVVELQIGPHRTRFDMDGLLKWIKYLKGEIATLAGSGSGFTVARPRSPSC